MPILKKSFTQERYDVVLEVDEKYDGIRLDQFLMYYYETFSRQILKKKIENGEVRIQGRPYPHKPSTKVHHLEIIDLVIPKTTHEDEYWNNELVDLELEPPIIFEDDNLIAISKPPFMCTHPTGRHIFNCATVFFETKTGDKVHSMHRIDRETSGVLLLGKNSQTAKVIREFFDSDQVRKAYFFISKINKDLYKGQKEFQVNLRLGPSEKGLRGVVIHAFSSDSDKGKHAQTKFKILYKNDDYAYGLAFPKTGRQHQIRVHAQSKGLPLLGDKLYLGNYKMFQRFKDGFATEADHELMEIPHQALHSIGIALPYKGGKYFMAPLPRDLKNFLEKKMDFNKEKEEDLYKELEEFLRK